MGNAAAPGLEQAPSEGREARNSVGGASGMSDPTPTLQKKQPAPPKLPMPEEKELEERFNAVLVSGCTGDKKAQTFTAHTKRDLVLLPMAAMVFVVEAGRIMLVHIQRHRKKVVFVASVLSPVLNTSSL